MSELDARRCVERIKSDPDFGLDLMLTEDIDVRVAMIRAAGLDCTWEELVEAFDPYAAGQDQTEATTQADPA